MKGRSVLINLLALGLMLALVAGLALAQGPEPGGTHGNHLSVPYKGTDLPILLSQDSRKIGQHFPCRKESRKS